MCLQAFWRGHQTRNKELPTITQIRKRSKQANLNAEPHRTLGHLREQALKTLASQSSSFNQIIAALRDLGKFNFYYFNIQNTETHNSYLSIKDIIRFLLPERAKARAKKAL